MITGVVVPFATVLDRSVPVVPRVIAATLVTVPLVAGAEETQEVPLAVRMLPFVVGATKVGLDVPLPRMTLLAVSVANPVPPEATGKAAPRVSEEK